MWICRGCTAPFAFASLHPSHRSGSLVVGGECRSANAVILIHPYDYIQVYIRVYSIFCKDILSLAAQTLTMFIKMTPNLRAEWIRSQQLLFVQQSQTSLNDLTRSESSVPIRNCLLEGRPFIQSQLKDRYQSSIGLWKIRLFKSESLEGTSRNTATNPQRVHGRPQRWWNHVGSHRTFRSARGRDDPFLFFKMELPWQFLQNKGSYCPLKKWNWSEKRIISSFVDNKRVCYLNYSFACYGYK